MFIKLALKSLFNRKGSVALTLLAMVVSIFVLLGVEHIRHQAKESFGNTVSGVDLIVGARTGSLNLLLYSVFRIGSPTNNLSWQSYEDITSNANIDWAIPISLGDSHKGYRVMGTSREYFKYFSYGAQRSLKFSQGAAFNNLFDLVLGSQVAQQLGYKLGDTLVLSHGIAATSFSTHDDKPFTVVGILEPTGTPVDQTLHVSLQGIEAIHIDWQQGVKIPGRSTSEQQLQQLDLTPKSITAFMVGLESKMTTFTIQRSINQYSSEPLMAILPGVALSELWQMMSMIENILRLISALVFIAALLGLSALLLVSIRERQQEINLLRSIGASPTFIFILIELEALLITLVATGVALIILCGTIFSLQDILATQFGLFISANIFYPSTFVVMAAIFSGSFIACCIPASAAFLKAQQK